MSADILYEINESWLALIVIVSFYVFAEIGLRLGLRSSKNVEDGVRAHVATVEGALLGLLALLLGFAFSMSMARYEARRSVVVNEANDLQTTYLRARLLSESNQSVISKLLREYVESRIQYFQAGADRSKMQSALDLTIALQTQLWNQAIAAARENTDEVTTGYFIESLNNLIDDHTKRMTAMENHVPEVILYLLIFVGSMSLAMTGYSSGLGSSRLFIPRFLLIILTAATLIVIVDLDRPRRGFITVSEKALIELRESLKKS